jgi:GAF domain-containing protein
MTTSERARHPEGEPPPGGVADEGVLARSAHRLSRSLELDELLGATRDLVMEAVGCEKVSLLIYDGERERHRFHLIHNQIRSDASSSRVGGAEDAEELFLEREEGLAGWILRITGPLRINEAASDTRIQHERHRRLGVEIRQVLAVPLSRGRQHTGVLVAVNKPGGFTERDEQLLVTISENVSLALANALLYRRSERERRELESL